ncbi:MFS transporter [Pseudonocardia nigra]|uniref:MFS transporter n=1 Tax=Pseudonocardia nigra TaxID=1921578 RepID=UPI001C5E26A4|nr:MFS transporter [Pseudonocardia nigra]
MTSSTPAPAAVPRAAWRTAVLGGMASYMDAATIVSTGTALVLFQPALGLTPWDIGALSALLTLGLAIGALLGGRLGDLLGRRRVFTVDLVVFVVGLALLVGAVNTPMLYAGVVIAGLAMGADIPTSLALIAEEAPRGQRGRLVAFSQLLWVGGIIGAVVFSALFSGLGTLGARLLYAHMLVVALVVLVLRRRLVESQEWRAARAEQPAVEVEGAISGSSLRHLMRGPLLAAVVATGLYYGIGNLAANTFGQFQTYLFVNVAGTSVTSASLIGLLGFPVGLVGAVVFMRVADRPSRMRWFAFGAVLLCGGTAVPLVFGISLTTLIIMALASGLGGPFAGEAIYKVWSQELFPTLLRGSAQGITIAFTRILAAAFAFVTPAIAAANASALIGICSR